MSSWNPDADFYLGVMCRHSGLVKATARQLMLKSLLDGLRSESPATPMHRHYPGPLGRYESAKVRFAEAGLPPVQYEAACRRAAREAGV